MPEIGDLVNRISSSSLNTELKEILNFFAQCFQNIIQSNANKDKQVDELESRVTSLEAEIQVLKDTIDDNNQYERKDTVVVSGPGTPQEEDGENCKAKIIQHLNDNLGLDTPLAYNDINICHRVGKKRTPPGPHPRAIYIKFCRRDVIPEIYAKCREHRPNFFVSDSQTPTRSKISYLLRQLKKKDSTKIVAVVASRGDPVALIPQVRASQRLAVASTNPPKVATKRVTITTRLQLEYFVRDHFGSTLQELELQW